MRELSKFNLEINFIPNELEKYMSYAIVDKLIFVGSFQFLSSSLYSLDENLGKDDIEYFIQEFDNNVLDLVKLKGFYPYEHMNDFEKFKKDLPSKERFYSSLTRRKITGKEYKYFLHVPNKFERKTMKYYHGLYLKCNVLLLADTFENLEIMANILVIGYVQVII